MVNQRHGSYCSGNREEGNFWLGRGFCERGICEWAMQLGRPGDVQGQRGEGGGGRREGQGGGHGGHFYGPPVSFLGDGRAPQQPPCDSWPVTTLSAPLSVPPSAHISPQRSFTSFLAPDDGSPPLPGHGGYSAPWNMACSPVWPPALKSEDLSGEDSHSPRQDFYFNSTYSDAHLFPHSAHSPGADEERTKRRREQNKMAAQRCRHRRRQHIDELVKELQALECDNTSLTYEIHQLRKEKSNLEMTLGQHAPSCPSRTLQLAPVTTEVNQLMTSGQ